MANRQCSKGRPTRALSSGQPGMFARAKSQTRQGSPAGGTGRPRFSEPEVRRWPHPVPPASSAAPETAPEPAGATLHYIRCAMSYQNQLLADIKVLLEQLAADEREEK